ncbi:MAG TPA: S8 family peptidase [Cyclobacteriaceae bacterium]|nr:S8 family peptidase [Cyclobacteriaceae bacterium]
MEIKLFSKTLGKFIKSQITIVWMVHAAVFAQVKFSPHLQNQEFKPLTQSFFSVSVKDSSLFKEKYKGKIIIHRLHHTSRCFVISVQKDDVLSQMKTDSNILFVDSHRPAVEEAVLDFVNPSFNRITSARKFFPSLNGVNQNVSIKELSFDTNNIDLLNRSFTTSVSPSSTSEHATTMATLIGGGGNSSYQALGVISKAHFTSSDYTNLFPDFSSIFISNNIHLQNHSYGVGIENYYGNEAFAYDQQVYQNPNLLHIFSVGNLGTSSPTTGIYQNMPFANLSGNFKQAKNVLIVNAVDSTLKLNALNSRGPAFDGRVKPELTAYGQGGTSEAAALVSGISALLQEQYQSINNTTPEASMIKAILIASADDLGTAGIDYYYGYGSANALNALKIIESNQLTTATLNSNDHLTIPIVVPVATKEIKIAIAWNDPPSVVNSNSVLVNDIDSWIDDGTTKTLPWVLSNYPNTDSLTAPAKRKADHLNNVEYISLYDPAPGTYQLNLKSDNLNGSTQRVAFAYWLRDTTVFQWDFPVASDIVETKKKTLLVWQSLPNQIGDLYLQLNQGNWQLIRAGIDLKNYFYWTSPDTLAHGRLKMKIGNREFISDEFLISPKVQITTAFNCADSIGLTWNKINGATGYYLYKMGNQFLQEIDSTSSTLVVLPKTSDEYFTVSPAWNGVSGLKSETINYEQQGALCYFNLFAAERFSATQVKVTISLSSWYSVDHLIIYKTGGGIKTIYKTYQPSELLQFSLYDTDLVAGVMVYQAELIFKNGANLLSDVSEVPIEEKGKAIIYPNPVTTENYLNILSEGGGLQVRILDCFGRALMVKTLELVIESIDISDLASGFYFYQIADQGKINVTGKIIKL